jgi:hypothetical protein
MRDFRDAKAMARALRDALKAKAIETKHTEALELIAKAFGYENWNILSARIEVAERPAAGSATLPAEARHNLAPSTFSRSLEQSIHRAFALANERHHKYATLEHLLLALLDDQDDAAVMRNRRRSRRVAEIARSRPWLCQNSAICFFSNRAKIEHPHKTLRGWMPFKDTFVLSLLNAAAFLNTQDPQETSVASGLCEFAGQD